MWRSESTIASTMVMATVGVTGTAPVSLGVPFDDRAPSSVSTGPADVRIHPGLD